MRLMKALKKFGLPIITLGLNLLPLAAQAEIDGHGPDAWRVTGVASDDVLNARMGPGTDYPVIETFAHNERGLEEITCVPFYKMAHFSAMTEAEREGLTPRWCLMRSADLAKAGWVAQRYLIADFDDDVLFGDEGGHDQPGKVMDVMKIRPAPTAGTQTWSSETDLLSGLWRINI